MDGGIVLAMPFWQRIYMSGLWNFSWKSCRHRRYEHHCGERGIHSGESKAEKSGRCLIYCSWNVQYVAHAARDWSSWARPPTPTNTSPQLFSPPQPPPPPTKKTYKTHFPKRMFRAMPVCTAFCCCKYYQ